MSSESNKNRKYSASQLDIFETTSREEGIRKNITIFQASAGSGKTFTLVKEYIKILLMDPSQYEHILAITFTNEATKEMKGRVLEELQKISNGDQSAMWKALKEDRHLSKMNIPFERRAGKALTNILHNYSRFDISTIDHFFTRIVRSLAWELKLPIRYDIDVDNELAIDTAINKLFGVLGQERSKTHGEENLLMNWLEEFAFSRLEDDKGWNVEYNLHKLGLELFEEKFHNAFSKTEISLDELKDFVPKLSIIRNNYLGIQKDLAKEALSLIKSHNLKISDFKGGNRGVANTFKKILDGDVNLTSTFIKVANKEDEWYAQKALKRVEIKQVAPELDEIADKIYTNHNQLYRKYVTASHLLRNIFSYGLLEFLNEKLQEYRTENNLMLLSDTGFLLKDVIQDLEAPFLFEKVGCKYNHILIDEFQDTSNYQWSNLRPLVRNSASNEHKVFIAGDVKQSIYRWRGGNMNLLINGVRKDLEPFADQIGEETLLDNRRSGRNIISFNNNFFELARELMYYHPELTIDKDLVKEAYKTIRQNPIMDYDGYVRVEFFEFRDENDVFWQDRVKAASVEVVKKCLDDGYSLRDIMILVDLRLQANELADVFSKQGISVITESSLLVENNDVVRLLISIMEWFQDPGNQIAQTNILYQYFRIKNNEEKYNRIFTDITKNDEALFKTALPGSFHKRRSELSRKSVYEMVEELIMIFDLGNKADIFLQRFEDIILEQSAKGRNDLNSFLEWWEEKTTRRDKNAMKELSIISPADSNAIQIMTIHKAKGLESPIVIIPFAGSTFSLKAKQDSTFWTENLKGSYARFKLLPLNFTKELKDSDFEEAYRIEYLESMIERLNVAYVAFTRAKERLYLFGNTESKSKKKEEIDSLNSLIYRVFEHPSFEFRPHWNDDLCIFEMGSENKRETETTGKKESNGVMQDYPVRSFKDKIRIRPDSKKFFLLFDNEKARKIREGVQVHVLLERLENIDGLEQVLNQLKGEGLIKEKDKNTLKDIVDNLFKNQQFRKWFDTDWKVITEKEIFSEGTSLKPDRILVKDDKAVVIDFKREKHDHRHEKQVMVYASLLHKMGYKDIKKYLFYVQEGKVLEIKK